MKKLISLFLVFTMIFALSVSASAAEADHPYPNLCDCESGGSLEYDDTYLELQDWSDADAHYWLEYDAFICTECGGYSYSYSRELSGEHEDWDEDGFCDVCGY